MKDCETKPEMENQVQSPFSVPPPELSKTEKIQRDYYESTLKVKDGFLAMNDNTILNQTMKIQELYQKIYDVETIVEKLKKENKILTHDIKKHEKQYEAEHQDCEKEFRDLEEDFYKYADENEALKEEIFKCKFKEKHIEGSRNLNKKKEYDEKCVKIELENIKLKQDIEMLSSCNIERFDEINILKKEIDDLKTKVKSSQLVQSKTVLKEPEFTLKCDFCEYQFPSKSHLKKHLLKDHEIKAKNKTSQQMSNLLQDINKLQQNERSLLKSTIAKGCVSLIILDSDSLRAKVKFSYTN